MEATPRATSRARINREHPVVTRHGVRTPDAATPKLRRRPPGTPVANIRLDVLDISRGQMPLPDSSGEKSHSPMPRQRQRQAGFAITTTKQNSKSP